MKLILDLLFSIFIGYHVYKFIQLMFKMRKDILFPKIVEEFNTIQKYPQKPINLPTYSKQKLEIIIYSLVLLAVISMFIWTVFLEGFDAAFYLLLLLPLANSHNLINLFAIVDDGVLSGSRFISWKKIRSFHFVPIDMNHKYYGFSPAVNEGYELILKERIFSISCIVTSEESKVKLTQLFDEYGLEQKENSLYKVSLNSKINK